MLLQQQRPTRLAYAILAAWTYAKILHRDGIDRGLIATFSNEFKIRLDFTTSLARVASTLNAIAQEGGNGRTRLYDSLADLVHTYMRAGARGRVWPAAVVTDGMDNESTNYPAGNANSPEMIGRYIHTRFTHEPTSHLHLFGVGDGHQVDMSALGTMARFGHFTAAPVEAFPELVGYLQGAALAVTDSVSGLYDPYSESGYLRRSVTVTRKVADYALLIDVSESMNEPV